MTSPKAGRFRVAPILLFPTLDWRAVVVVVVVISVVVEASFDRVTRVCCTLFSSCSVFGRAIRL